MSSPPTSPDGGVPYVQVSLKDLFEDIKRKYEQTSSKSKSGRKIVDWPTFFETHFIKTKQEDWDDLVFYVVWRNKECTVETYRRDSKILPLTKSMFVNWEESAYLNLLMHGFEFRVTTVICTAEKMPTGKSSFNFNAETKLRVYPSVARRRMDSREEGSDVSYPKIQFQIDSYSEVFSNIIAKSTQHFFGLELIAVNEILGVKYVLFAGKVPYNTIKKVHENKAKPNFWGSIGKGMKSVFTPSQKSYDVSDMGEQFLKMSGPNGCGSAEVAVSLSEPETMIVTNRSSVSDSFEDTPHFHVKRDQEAEVGVAPLSAQLTSIELPWSSILDSIFFRRKTPDFPH